MTDSDAALVQRARAGERAAFVALYQNNYVAVYNYVFYRVGTEAVANDVVAEVFVRLVQNVAGIELGNRPVLPWLYTVARNLITDHFRAAQREEPLAADETRWLSDGDPHHDPVAVAEQRWTQTMLRQALTHLTEDQQQVILLRFIEGCSVKLTAARLDKSSGAIKLLQHRGLKALRRVLRKEYGYEG